MDVCVQDVMGLKKQKMFEQELPISVIIITLACFLVVGLTLLYVVRKLKDK